MALPAPRPTAASRLNARPVTLAVIVGNRGFFPAHLALSGRNTILEVLAKAGIEAIITPAEATNVRAIYGRIRQDPFSYLRITSDDFAGTIRAYVGEGQFTGDPVETFGGYGVVEVPRFQELLAYICQNGYEHHVSVNQAHVAAAIDEAFNRYLAWPTYYHR